MNHKKLKDIPKEFYSASTGEPFERCIECDKYLLGGETEYLIEKAIKNYPGFKAQDTIFDYAICMLCAHKMHSKMSDESLAKIQDYFSQNLNMEDRLKNAEGDDDFTTACLIKGTNREQSSEFQLYAHCKGDKLFLGNPPYLISGEAMEEVMKLLSKSTKDELGGFFEKHFSPDPDLFETDPCRRLILI